MITYRDINAAGDVTRWLRDEATGLVTNKVYADGKGPRYCGSLTNETVVGVAGARRGARQGGLE